MSLRFAPVTVLRPSLCWLLSSVCHMHGYLLLHTPGDLSFSFYGCFYFYGTHTHTFKPGLFTTEKTHCLQVCLSSFTAFSTHTGAAFLVKYPAGI